MSEDTFHVGLRTKRSRGALTRSPLKVTERDPCLAVLRGEGMKAVGRSPPDRAGDKFHPRFGLGGWRASRL